MEECFVIHSREYDLESSRLSNMMQRIASWYELSRLKGHLSCRIKAIDI